ncbi:LytTR family DNA-binding domain-containing protein [Paraglaciecola aquimarina]|uniref:LytTR family DNA-binding domain-containing protein n=1 Tax=Paraglaciecola aquimarina TaxID=1235557 RepID=A0ABU3SSH6_9ALTE|nr:LytTR family DNA-binding domain-containing protein [Paraglaciecola aquimarina]MDU0352969.1 LytTR family DNA-binding domain-containing protein [Paraglaciecola aquimarina]
MGKLLLLWATFFTFMTAYCYSYMLVINDSPYYSWQQALQCVIKDWLVWLAVSPWLLHAACNQNLSTRKGRWVSLTTLAFCCLMVSSYRVLIEYLVQGYDAISTIYIYFPRYVVASALTLITCSFYMYRLRTEAQLKQFESELSQLQNVSTNAAQTFVVYKGQAKVIISELDIICIQVSGNYLQIQTIDDNYLMRKTMKEIEQELAADKFVRIHRSHLVKLSAIHSICRSTLDAKLHNQQILPIGKKYLKSLPHFS